MPTDPNMTGLIYPTEGGSEDTWDTIMNSTCWPVLGAHSHTPGDGVPIRSAALQINADVSWSSGGSNFSITDLKAIDFTPVAPATVSALASALYVSSSDSNLYFRNQSGTAVKITDGSTLNISIVGGITGDYASVGAALSYDDASDTYLCKQEQSLSVRQYGKIAHSDIKLFEYKAAGVTPVPSNSVTMKSPAALAASYSLTLFTAVPASQQIVQLDASGNLFATNTIANDVTYAADKNIILAGTTNTTGVIKHGTRLKAQTVVSDYSPSGSVSNGVGGGSGVRSMAIASASTVFYCKLSPLVKGERLVSLTLAGPNYETGSSNIVYDVMKLAPSDSDFASLLSAPVSSGSAYPSNITLTLASSGRVITGDEGLWLKVTVPAATSVSYSTVGQNFDHP
jgi:hypothetical protein